MTSKRLVARAAATLLLGLGALTGAHAQTVLKVSHFLPPGSNFQKNFLEPWCEKIAKDSADKLKCQIYPALQLGGTPAQLADQVKNGVSDIVWTSPSYSTGRFPRTEALELPFTMPPDGNYIAAVHGWNAANTTFDIAITAVQAQMAEAK